VKAGWDHALLKHRNKCLRRGGLREYAPFSEGDSETYPNSICTAWHQSTSPPLAIVPDAPFSIFPFLLRVSFYHVLDTWLHIRSHVRCLWRIRCPWLKKENCRPREASQLVNGRGVPGMSTLVKETKTFADLVELVDPFWRPPPSDIRSAQ
jgi:hypothetical protein